MFTGVGGWGSTTFSKVYVKKGGDTVCPDEAGVTPEVA
jgi:hypothetical protein